MDENIDPMTFVVGADEGLDKLREAVLEAENEWDGCNTMLTEAEEKLDAARQSLKGCDDEYDVLFDELDEAEQDRATWQAEADAAYEAYREAKRRLEAAVARAGRLTTTEAAALEADSRPI